MLMNDGNKWKLEERCTYNGVSTKRVLVRTNSIKLEDKEEEKNDAPF